MKKIFSIINDNEINLIGTPLQFLNLIEYHFKYNSSYFDKPRKIFVCNAHGREIDQINFIKKKLNLNYEIIHIDNKIVKLLLLISCYFKKIYNKNFFLTIIGDYENIFFSNFFKFSRKVIFLDDGTNIFSVKKDLKKKLSENSNYYFFSFFDKKFLGTKKYLNNDFLFLKSKIKKIRKKNKIFFLGNNYIEQKIFYLKTFKKIEKFILQKFSYKKLSYFPHPKETANTVKKTVFLKTVKSSLPFELYLILNNEIPKTIISHNSTAFVSIKKIFSSKIELLNLFVKEKKNNRGENYNNQLFQQHLKTIKYFEKYLKIKTTIIK